VEVRKTSVVWNYRESVYEFGKLQAQDMLQHLSAGSISNSAVEVVRGSRSVEVRSFGVNKGVSMRRTIDLMSRHLGPQAVAFDYVLCIGHFMVRDEAIFSYFEGMYVYDASSKLECIPACAALTATLIVRRRLCEFVNTL
jgi:trehalose 6-phosphate synthase/phosphatase